MDQVHNKILVVYAHPYPRRSRIHRVLRQSIAEVSGIKIHDIYEKYPDYHIDIRHEQKALMESNILVLQHPVYCFRSP